MDKNEYHKTQGNGGLAVFVVVILVLIAGAVFYVYYSGMPFLGWRTKTDVPALVKGTLPSDKYTSLVYHYQAVVSRKMNPNSVFSKDKVIFVLDGTIKLGLDCGRIDVKEAEGQIILSMPVIDIVSHEQYPESAEALDENFEPFPGKFSGQERERILGSVDTELKKQEEKLSLDTELFQQARVSVEQLFKPLLEENPAIKKGKYTVVFEWQADSPN